MSEKTEEAGKAPAWDFRRPSDERAEPWVPDVAPVERFAFAMENMRQKIQVLLDLDLETAAQGVQQAALQCSVAYTLFGSIFMKLRAEGYDGSILDELKTELEETMQKVAAANDVEKQGKTLLLPFVASKPSLKIDKDAAHRIVKHSLSDNNNNNNNKSNRGDSGSAAAGKKVKKHTKHTQDKTNKTKRQRDDDDDDDDKSKPAPKKKKKKNKGSSSPGNDGDDNNKKKKKRKTSSS